MPLFLGIYLGNPRSKLETRDTKPSSPDPSHQTPPNWKIAPPAGPAGFEFSLGKGARNQGHLVVGAVAGADDRAASSELREGSDGAQSVLRAEGHNLDGEGERGAEALAELRVVDDADELLGHDLDHLLTEESTTAALDEGKVGVDGVGAVDGDVEGRLLVQGAERDVQALGLRTGPLVSV